MDTRVERENTSPMADTAAMKWWSPLIPIPNADPNPNPISNPNCKLTLMQNATHSPTWSSQCRSGFNKIKIT